MKSPYYRTACVFMVFSLLVSGGTVLSADKTFTTKVPMEAREFNGEVYVKAGAMVQALGGTGTYDAKTKTFQYLADNPVPKVIQKVSPSVVAIIGKPNDPDSIKRENRYELAHGTGVIVKADGWIITNAHVVKDMNNILVVTSNGKEYTGKTTHIDEESDLAIVKISAVKLPVVTFAVSANVQVGETVVAIGTPISFSLRNSATVGVISGLDRSVNSTYRLIQTDAAINPGNSGGALVNLKGEIVGINSLKFVDVSVDSMGFAIPADTVQYVLNQFIKFGKVKRPFTGVELEESFASVIGLPSDEPLKVVRVDGGSPAFKAGMKEGDILYSIDNIDVTTLVDYNEALKKYLPGQKAQFMMQSEGDLIKRSVTFGETN